MMQNQNILHPEVFPSSGYPNNWSIAMQNNYSDLINKVIELTDRVNTLNTRVNELEQRGV